MNAYITFNNGGKITISNIIRVFLYDKKRIGFYSLYEDREMNTLLHIKNLAYLHCR